MVYKGLILLGFLVLAGCDDGEGDSGGGTFNSNVDDSKQLSSLDDAEVKALCESVTSTVGDLANQETQICTYVAAQLTMDKATCEEAVERCIDAPEEEPMNEDPCADASAADLMGCDATVGTYETCINDFLSSFSSKLSGASCDNAGQGSGELFPTPTNTPSCAALVMQCPKLFEDDEEDTNEQ